MRKILLPIAALALLSACDSASEPSEPVTTVETDAASTEEPLDVGAIPDQFLGIWDYVKGTCAPESDMRMEIKAGEIIFYESNGMVAGIEAEGDDTLVDLMMSGEGSEWIEAARLSLSEDGKTLSISDGEKPKVADDYPRKRCA